LSIYNVRGMACRAACWFQSVEASPLQSIQTDTLNRPCMLRLLAAVNWHITIYGNVAEIIYTTQITLGQDFGYFAKIILLLSW
jgi:hypothetical protein